MSSGGGSSSDSSSTGGYDEAGISTPTSAYESIGSTDMEVVMIILDQLMTKLLCLNHLLLLQQIQV
jgi:hypothetical protein